MLKQTLKYDLSNLENILFDSYKFTAKELAIHYIDLIYSSNKHIKAFNEFPKSLLSAAISLSPCKTLIETAG